MAALLSFVRGDDYIDDYYYNQDNKVAVVITCPSPSCRPRPSQGWGEDDDPNVIAFNAWGLHEQ